MQSQISWLLQKPTDLDLHCLKRQDISGFSITRLDFSANLLKLICSPVNYITSIVIWRVSLKVIKALIFVIPPMPKGFIVFISSVHPFICLSFCLSVHPSIHLSFPPSVILSINTCYNQVLLQSFLITYISAATDKKLFIFGLGVPGRVLFHSTSMNPRAGLEVKI